MTPYCLQVPDSMPEDIDGCNLPKNVHVTNVQDCNHVPVLLPNVSPFQITSNVQSRIADVSRLTLATLSLTIEPQA